MLCPNCKTELVEVNGRYICSECGKEVPISEVSVGTWDESGEKLKIHPTPGSQSVSKTDNSTEEPTDYIEGEASSVNNTGEKTEESKEKVISPSATPSGVAWTPKIAEPVKTVDSFEDIDKQVFGNNAPEKPAENPEIPQAFERGALEVESAGNIDLNNTGVDVTLDSEIYTDPIYEESAPKETPPNLNSKSTDSKVLKPLENEPERESRINIIIITVSSIFVVAFIIIGIVAFISLSGKAKVPLTNGKSLNDKIVNCGDTDSDESKSQCIAENFKICASAKWSNNFTSIPDTEVDYQIMGLSNSTCLVNITMKKYVERPETVNKTMSCELVINQEFEKASSSLSKTNCSGSLANLIYDSSSETTSVTPSPSVTPVDASNNIPEPVIAN